MKRNNFACAIVLSIASLLCCKNDYYDGMMIGTWEGSGHFSPLSWEYSYVEMRFTADSLYWSAIRSLDSLNHYGLGTYTMTETQYTWSIMYSDSHYNPDIDSWHEITATYTYKDGVFRNDWELELRRK